MATVTAQSVIVIAAMLFGIVTAPYPYIGCVVNDITYSYPPRTTTSFDTCSHAGAKSFFIMANGNQCYVDYLDGIVVTYVDGSLCDILCDDGTSKCGGTNYASIYATCPIGYYYDNSWFCTAPCSCGGHTCYLIGGACTICSTPGTSGNPCGDFDECTRSNGGCGPGTTCVNTVGSFTCSCNTPGLVLNADGKTCGPPAIYRRCAKYMFWARHKRFCRKYNYRAKFHNWN